MNIHQGAPAPTPRSLSALLLAGVAIVSAASGLIHFGVVAEHWGTYHAAAVFFVAIGIFQVLWGALVLGRPTRGLYAAGAGAALLTIGLWAMSRTTGLPFGPFAGIPERVGRADVISTVLEELSVLAIVVLAFMGVAGHHLTRRTYRVGVSVIAVAAAALTGWALASVHGGVQHFGHHGFHLLFAGGAVAVYFVYLVVHIRSHGRPSFSWRLTPVVTQL